MDSISTPALVSSSSDEDFARFLNQSPSNQVHVLNHVVPVPEAVNLMADSHGNLNHANVNGVAPADVALIQPGPAPVLNNVEHSAAYAVSQGSDFECEVIALKRSPGQLCLPILRRGRAPEPMNTILSRPSSSHWSSMFDLRFLDYEVFGGFADYTTKRMCKSESYLFGLPNYFGSASRNNTMSTARIGEDITATIILRKGTSVIVSFAAADMQIQPSECAVGTHIWPSVVERYVLQDIASTSTANTWPIVNEGEANINFNRGYTGLPTNIESQLAVCAGKYSLLGGSKGNLLDFASKESLELVGLVSNNNDADHSIEYLLQLDKKEDVDAGAVGDTFVQEIDGEVPHYAFALDDGQHTSEVELPVEQQVAGSHPNGNDVATQTTQPRNLLQRGAHRVAKRCREFFTRSTSR